MFWKKKVAQNNTRKWRELLRENLNTIAVDMFYGDDPIVALTPEDRRLYLKKFYELMNDKQVMGRIIYLVNKQANLTLQNAKSNDEEASMAGAMNINGLCLVKDEIEKLGAMYLKENKPQDGFDKYSII